MCISIQPIHHMTDVTEGQFLGKVNPVLILGFPSARLVNLARPKNQSALQFNRRVTVKLH